jgi:hypothetical protein
VDDEFGLALLRDRLRNQFGGFSGRVVAEFLPNVGARTTQSSKLSSGTT